MCGTAQIAPKVILKFLDYFLLFFFSVFLPFRGLLLWHMEVPRLRVESEL